MFEDFGILVGKYNASLPTLSDTQVSELQLDNLGRLILSGRHLEDSAHSSGDAGLQILAVRNDTEGSLVDTDGDYSALQVDNLGRLRVITDIDNVNIDFNSEKPEDSPHVSGDIGSYMLSVRADTLPANAGSSDNGDYSSLFVNQNGELWVKDADGLAKLTEIEVDTTAIAGSVSSIDSTLSNLSKAEDSAHSGGDQGVQVLAVRNDAGGALVSADGDYASLQLDANGRLYTNAIAELVPVGTEQFTVTDSLANGEDGLETITAAGTPWVTVASIAHATGTAYLYGYQWSCDKNAQMRIVTDDTVNIAVYKTDINSSATPGSSESWADGGRIEILGAANLEIKMQIKKRSTPGGNGAGTGSLHIRVA